MNNNLTLDGRSRNWPNKSGQLTVIQKNVDEKVESILARTDLSAAQIESALIDAVKETSFWKDECSGRLKDEIKRCADKFDFDGVDWTNCLKTSPLASTDYVGEWSPFYKEWQAKIRPVLKKGL